MKIKTIFLFLFIFAVNADAFKHYSIFDFLEEIVGRETFQSFQVFLKERPVFPPGTNYLKFFHLDTLEEASEDLPEGLKSKWGISRGYMTFLTLDMLRDRRARSRTQWVLNALRSRQIAGNKVNRNSMNSTISRLKSKGIAETVGKKVKLADAFVEDYEESLE